MESTENSPKAVKKPGSFVKGTTGNPGGRPKRTPEELDLIAACKKKVPQALDTLIAIMTNGENERNRITAAMAIIERAYGKPEQPIKADVDGKLVVEIVKYSVQ